MRGFGIGVSAISIATTIAAPAWAQASGGAAGTAATASSKQSAPETQAETAPNTAGAPQVGDAQPEIIVTGLKRDTKFINVPVSVQVFSEKTLAQAGITRPQDFLGLTPNVTFLTSNHAGEFFVNIRGQASVRQSESAVAVVIDGVQLATQNEFNGELFDVQQIEVLKGPQSAIYGRNAAAGAIVITTKQPTDTLDGQVSASYGNWNSSKVNASIGGALIPGKLRFRLAVSENDTDGPYTNINTGEKVDRSHESLFRSTLIWLVDDNTTVDVRANGSELRGGAIAFNAQVVGSTQGGVPTTKIDSNDTSLPYTSDVQGRDLQTKFNTSIKIDHDFGFAKLTSVTEYSAITDWYQAKNFPYGAYNFVGNSFVSQALSPGLDLDILAAFGDNTQKFRIANQAVIQEFRLTSKSDQRLRWQGGFFYLNSVRDFTTEQGLNGKAVRNAAGQLEPPYLGTPVSPVAPVTRNLVGGGSILPSEGIDGPDTNNPTLNYDRNRYTAVNVAPFGNVQFDFTHRLEADVALRYDIETRSVTTETPDIANPFFGVAPGAPAATYNLCVANTGLPAAQCHKAKTFRQVQPKVNLIYKLDWGSVFASYGKGFKSGGFNPIGTRATLQVGLPNITVQDSYDKETSDAYEIGFKSQFFQRRLSFNGAAFYTDVNNAQQFEFFPTGGIQAVSSIKKVRIKGFEFDVNARPTNWLTLFGGFGYIDATIRDIGDQDLAIRASIIGKRPPYSANSNVAAGAQIDHPISDRLNALARIEYTRTGTVFFDQTNAANTGRSPIDLVNARLGVGNDKFEFGVWSRNLNNKHYNSEAVVILPVAHAVYRAPGRSFGFEGKFRF